MYKYNNDVVWVKLANVNLELTYWAFPFGQILLYLHCNQSYQEVKKLNMNGLKKNMML